MTAPPALPSLYWDGYGLQAAASGVYVHARNLADELHRLGAPPTILGPRGSASLFADVSVIEVAGRSRVGRLKPVWPQLVGDRVRSLQGDRPYILHGLSNFNLPPWGRDRQRRCVLTVHDLIPFLAPKGVSKALRAQLAVLMPRALKRADAVVCVSHWTKRTLVERYPFVEARCHVIPNGLPTAAASKTVAAPKADGPIEALYIARFEPYKQHTLLLEVVRTCPWPLRLTLVTDPGGVAACSAAAPDLVQAGRLLFKSNLNQADIALAHAASDIYLSPSLYEGFSLPSASSLSAGKPVVYLSGSGIDEVVGGVVGVPLVAGAPVSAWHEAIAKGMALVQEAAYQNLLAAHLASLTTWKDAAKQLLSLYDCLK